VTDPLPDLSTMPEVECLRWLVAHMEPTPVTTAALLGLRWRCPECNGLGKTPTLQHVTVRLKPGEPGYHPSYGSDLYDPSQHRTVPVTQPCSLCHGVGRLDHEPRRVQTSSERWG